MELFNLIVAVVLGLLLTAFAVYLFITIMFNVQAGRRYRQSLARRINELRLGKMLAALSIDTYQYLHKERGADIKQQMNRCSACENINECDENLTANTITTENIAYCNNEESLRQMLVEDIESNKHPDKQ